MDAKQTPRPHPDVIWRVLDGEAVIVSPHEGHVRVLNQVATTIWMLLDGRRTVGDIQLALSDKYDVAANQAAADVRRFLDDLSSRGLLID